MQINELTKYIKTTLNIDTSNPYIVDDILEELESISNLNEFKSYLKAQTTQKEYQYLTNFQKFLKIAQNYKAKEKQKIVLANPKINSFSEELFKKTCDVFEEINWLIQSGNDLESEKIKKLIYIKFANNKKEVEVLKAIGDKSELLRLVKHSKDTLRDKIRKVVTDLTIKKNSEPLIEYQDKNIIKKLQNRSK